MTAGRTELDRPDHGFDPSALMAKLLAPAGRADPYPVYAELRSIGPVTRWGESTCVVSGYDAVNRALRDPALGFPDTGALLVRGTPSGALASMRTSILRANPPDHGRMRTLMANVFTPRRVVGLTPMIERAVDGLLGSMTAGSNASADFMEAVAFPLPVSVICELLGVPRGDHTRFRPLAADLTEVLELSGDSQPSSAASAAAEELSAYFTDLVDQKRTAPSDDLIGALVAARDADDSRLSDEELLANLVMLLVAGFETTTNLLGNGISLLSARPGIAAALVSGEVEVAAFVEEVLRFDSPVQLTTRVVRGEDARIEGVDLPRGADVVLLIGAANRDPARYDDPDRFDPTRSDIRPLSFGAGPHVCLGNQLARLEASIAFRRIVDLGLHEGSMLSSTRRDRLVLRGFKSLVLGRRSA